MTGRREPEGATGGRLPAAVEETPPPRGLALLVLPGTLVLAAFFAAYASFVYQSLLRAVPATARIEGPVSLGNYARLFTSTADLAVLGETLWVAALLTAITLAVGYPLAYLIVRTESRRLRTLLLFSLVVTFLSGGVTRAYSWLIVLGNNGLVNGLLRTLGVVEAPLRLVHNRLGVFVALVHFLLPFTVLTLVGPLRNVPRALEEASINLGATNLQTFLRVTLPVSLRGIIAAASLTYAIALSAFLFPMLLGGGRVRMIANLIYEQIFVAYDLPFAAAIATTLLVVSVAVIAGFTWLQRLAVANDHR